MNKQDENATTQDEQRGNEAKDRRVRLSATIRGRVQGVGYRSFAVRQAFKLGIVGYVKNDYDGSVVVVAEGPEGALRALLALLSEGPSWARVRGVESTWSPATGDFHGFHVIG